MGQFIVLLKNVVPYYYSILNLRSESMNCHGTIFLFLHSSLIFILRVKALQKLSKKESTATIRKAAMEEVLVLALTNWPETILPNKFIGVLHIYPNCPY